MLSARAMSAAQRSNQPWPMLWVFVAILCTIVPYTYLRWHYRKPGHIYEPYHDMKERAKTLRLLSAGFQRVTLDADRPADPIRPPAAGPAMPAPAGLPAALTNSLIDQPELPTEVVSVLAAPTASARAPYWIGVTCTLPDNKRQIGGAFLYVRGEEAVIVPTFENLDDHLLARTREIYLRLTVPAGALKPGQYHVTLPGARTSKAWTLDVK
jgi:hypothetical protein